MRNLQHQFKINKYFVLISAVVLGTMFSCSPAQKETTTSPIQEQNQVQQTMLKADTSAAISSVPASVPATTTSNEPAIVNATATPPELNPPHGQPFHRCDIPVGSPLKSAAPAKPASVQTAPQINRTGTAPTLENAARLNNPQANNPNSPTVANANNPNSPTVANATKPKLNPPHGQPFHRCEIAVGSPLP
jgi:type IV secretory pathway VirB10-like protein